MSKSIKEMSKSMLEQPELASKTESVPYCLISSTEKYKQRWDMLVILCVVFNSFTIPLELAFSESSFDSGGYVVLDYAIDITFIIDILICFRTTYMDDMGYEVIDSWRIAKHYFKGTFIIDFLAAIPIKHMAIDGELDINPNI